MKDQSQIKVIKALYHKDQSYAKMVKENTRIEIHLELKNQVLIIVWSLNWWKKIIKLLLKVVLEDELSS